VNGGAGASGGASAAGEGGSAGSGTAGGGIAGMLPAPIGLGTSCGQLRDGPGSGGANGAGGAAPGGGSTAACTISAEATLATIPTVGIVTFTVSGLSDISNAKIEFGPASGGATLTAPVNLAEAGYRTLLLGMKASTRYAYRISVTGSAGTCTSSEFTIETGAVPSEVPKFALNVRNPEARARGFIVSTTGLTPVIVGQEPTGEATDEGRPRYAYILDSDGDVVWWWVAEGPTSAHMSWDGQEMFIVGSHVASVRMDGSDAESDLLGTYAHHDVTAIPGGFATLVDSSLVERTSDGTITTIVPDMAALYQPTNMVHTNALHYYGWDDSYTVSDSFAGLFIKITRQGELVWQLGGPAVQLAGDLPRDPAKYLRTAQWRPGGNHGHQLLPDGTFVFFQALACSGSSVSGYQLDPANLRANALFNYGLENLVEHLGDVQRLPNGNYLATISEAGQLTEFTPSGDLIATLQADDSWQLGYSEFRESLYGPPPY
jgi:hypothetical protein